MQATMHLSGRQLPPLAPLKRKERDEMFGLLKPSPKLAKPSHKPVPPRAVAPSKPSAHGNMLLAGYMAHEFLTKGTLLGQQYEPVRAIGPPASFAASSADFRAMKKPSYGNHGCVNRGKGMVVELEWKPSGDNTRLESEMGKSEKYVKVCEVLKSDEGHIPGIVNPSQLARFLHLE